MHRSMLILIPLIIYAFPIFYSSGCGNCYQTKHVRHQLAYAYYRSSERNRSGVRDNWIIIGHWLSINKPPSDLIVIYACENYYCYSHFNWILLFAFSLSHHLDLNHLNYWYVHLPRQIFVSYVSIGDHYQAAHIPLN